MRDLCFNEGLQLFSKCGVTKLHFNLPMVHSCVIHFEANLTPHVHPSLGEHPSLKQPGNVDVKFLIVSIYCQTTAHSNGADCTENAKATHKILLDLLMFNSNYQEIVEYMHLPDSGEVPHILPSSACLNTRGRTCWCWPGSWTGYRRTWLWRLSSRFTACLSLCLSWPERRTSPSTPACPCPFRK